MGGGNMNEVLGKYVKRNYEEGKADLFSVFMYLGMERLEKNGKQAQINMQSWMFLSSFEKLRHTFLTNYHLDNMLHLGPRTFDELSGEVVQNTAFVFTKDMPQEQGGTYYRLIDGKSCRAKEEIFLAGENCYTKVPQQNFNKIPGSPIGYWVSPKVQEVFTSNLALSEVCKPVNGLTTSDNARFLRHWFEVSHDRIGFGHPNAASAARSEKKWFPYNKGGSFRKWYGNQSLLINWEKEGKEIKSIKGPVLRNPNYYFKKSISWSLTSSVGCGFRFNPHAALFDVNGMSLFPENENDFFYLLGTLNTAPYKLFGYIINPTLALQCGDVGRFPTPFIKSLKLKQITECIAKTNYTLSRLDWDAHETSWDFQFNELVSFDREQYMDIMSDYAELNNLLVEVAPPHLDNLESRYELYKTKWETNFRRLHANEEELNRQFIDIYGLQDELTPDVPLNEITILQQGEVKIVDGTLQFQADVVIKQLISYAIGCWMGRYRLDKPGLYIAHPNAKEEEIVTYPYRDETLTIDDDGIIPILPYECPFEDNLQNRIAVFVRIAFGNDSLAENLNFVEQALGCTIEKYLDKEYWKDHKKMYQNRPIYWLWSSKKGAFRCISYMHRMDAYTAERVRSKYLLPYIEYLNNKIADLESRAAQLSVGESRKLDALRKAHTECVEYHERLQVIAEQAIAFDLDDGVVVNYAKFGDVLAKIK